MAAAPLALLAVLAAQTPPSPDTPAWLTVSVSIVSAVAVVGIAWGAQRGEMKALRADVDRMERDKASRESVDGLKALLVDMRAHFDQRFDRLESDTSPGRRA